MTGTGGDGWGHFSQRRDGENALENMALKATRILRKNKTVWSAGNWLAITTEVETLNEMWRKAACKTQLFAHFEALLSRFGIDKTVVLIQIMFLPL